MDESVCICGHNKDTHDEGVYCEAVGCPCARFRIMNNECTDQSMLSGALEDPSVNPTENIKQLLEATFWPDGVKTECMYSRVHDDNDGDHSQTIDLYITCDGDAWITAPRAPTRRIRVVPGGGGRSPRVHNALKILALAIKLDNEADPEFSGNK